MKTYLSEVKKYYDYIFVCKYAILLTSLLFIIDVFNFPTNLLFSHNSKVTIIFLVLFTLFVLLTVVELHLFDAIKIISVNIIDAITLIILLSSILYGGISFLYSTLNSYKIVSLILILIIATVLIISLFTSAANYIFAKFIIIQPATVIWNSAIYILTN